MSKAQKHGFSMSFSLYYSMNQPPFTCYQNKKLSSPFAFFSFFRNFADKL